MSQLLASSGGPERKSSLRGSVSGRGRGGRKSILQKNMGAGINAMVNEQKAGLMNHSKFEVKIDLMKLDVEVDKTSIFKVQMRIIGVFKVFSKKY